MEDYIGFKLKRKDLEDVNDDFSDFSLSSPARKIRRLDAELPPIIEEEEVDYQFGYKQSVPQNTISNGVGSQVKLLVIEELASTPENEEKAIVLFNPVNNPLVFSEGKFSVDPNLISCFRNKAFWGTHLHSGRPREEDEAMENENNNEENACRAVIPWVPSQTSNPVPQSLASQTEMDAEEMEATSMEIEDADAANVGQQASEYINFSKLNEGLQHQWHQHHCMIPQPPQNITTPLVWYR